MGSCKSLRYALPPWLNLNSTKLLNLPTWQRICLYPYRNFFVNVRLTLLSSFQLMHGGTCLCGVGVGVSDSFCINLKCIIPSEQRYHTLFSIFHISGDGNQSRAEELKLKMFCGRRCLMVENVWWLKNPCGQKCPFLVFS